MGCTVEGQEGLVGIRRFRMADLAVITDCFIRIMTNSENDNNRIATEIRIRIRTELRKKQYRRFYNEQVV